MNQIPHQKIQWSIGQCLLRLLPLVITISFAMDVFVPAIPMMVKALSTQDAYLQASLYLFMLVVGFTQLLLGFAPPALSRKKMALYAAIAFVAGSILCVFATSIPMLLLGRIIQAIGATGTYTVCFILVRDNYDTRQCAVIFSLLLGYNSVVASLAPVIGGFLLDLTGYWQSGFYFLVLLGGFVLFQVIFAIPDYRVPLRGQDISQRFHYLQKILSNAYFSVYSFIGATALLGLYLFCALSSSILMTQLHNSPSQYGLWFGLNAITVFFANGLAAKLLRWRRLESLVTMGLMFIVLGCIAMAFAEYFYFSSLSFMLSMLMITLGIGLSMGSSEALALKDFEDNAVKATSLFCFFQFTLSGLMGFILSFGYLSARSLYLPVFVFSMVSLLLLFRFNKLSRVS